MREEHERFLNRELSWPREQRKDLVESQGQVLNLTLSEVVFPAGSDA